MKKFSPLVALYSVTLLLSAALLFSVQPMFSKMVLPYLGGTPQVWNTAMLFFQLMLLGGYAYAHGTTRFLSVRAQAILQVILLGVFAIVLPIAIPAGWDPPTDKDPTMWQLTLMAATVGGPFFVLAASAPMLQRWFAASGDKDADNPYFLYGASNLGSITALLAYPFIIEPMMDLTSQSHTWTVGYFALIALTALSGFMIWKSVPAKIVSSAQVADMSLPITWKQRCYWLFLAFVPSSMMLGVTTFITMDIASAPLLWIIPLALYVGTFIIVFARKPIIDTKLSATIQATLLIVMLAQKITLPLVNPFFLVGIHIAVFFFSALTCHLELAKSRPSARNLTEFYLIMSIGGALGGFFNAILAPQLLIIPLEYGFAVFAACLMRYSGDPYTGINASLERLRSHIKQEGMDCFSNSTFLLASLTLFTAVFIFTYPGQFFLTAGTVIIAVCLAYLMDRRWLFSLLIGFTLGLFPLGYHYARQDFNLVLHQDRNFFGILRIADTKEGERILLNGTTNHGTQALDKKHRLTPLAYYGSHSPVSDVFNILDQKNAPQDIGILGLGVGVLACYHHPGRNFEYFEINPLVKEIAENPKYFTFLSDCGSSYQIHMGDGRLTLQKQPDRTYDLMIIDAFTSDNIPIHLLTLEALELYMQKIKPDGSLIVHISNRFLDLEPVLEEAAKAMGVPAIVRVSEMTDIPGTEYREDASHWVLLSKNPEITGELTKNGWDAARPRKGVKMWTDQYSNIFSVLINKTGMKRSLENIEKKEADEAKGVHPPGPSQR